MASRALVTWRTERGRRLDDLLHAHQSVGGPARGRRWRTATLNEALVLRLAAEFQGFARDLHDQACEVFASWIASGGSEVRQVVRNQLTYDRALERGNAHPGSIGSDFGRFGFDVWPALARRDRRTARHHRSLQLLNEARNGIAHADEGRLLKLRAEGFPLVLGTCRRLRHDLDGLAANLDRETATQLGRLCERQEPW